MDNDTKTPCSYCGSIGAIYDEEDCIILACDICQQYPSDESACKALIDCAKAVEQGRQEFLKEPLPPETSAAFQPEAKFEEPIAAVEEIKPADWYCAVCGKEKATRCVDHCETLPPNEPIAAVQPGLTEAEEERRGQIIAEVLRLRRDSEHKDRYLTTWGTKTNIGIWRTVQSMIQEADRTLRAK